MRKPMLSRRDWIRCSLSLMGAATASGCGTILHPERRGQAAGPIDWKIAALDGVGLLFFFVPGVIAFAVDFSNGTIYLPPEECAAKADKPRRRTLISRHIPPEKLSRRGLESLVTKHVQRPIALTPGRYQTRALRHMDEFWNTHDDFAASA